MQESATQTVLDRRQLSNVTLDDEELMREIVAALIEDTARQLPLLADAISTGDGVRAARLAHYSKGACANLGAASSAYLLQAIERTAANGDFSSCSVSLAALMTELERLRVEAQSL